MEAVLVVDMLNDFVTGKLACDRARAIIPPLQALLDAARAAGRPVVYLNDAHFSVDPEIALWGEHAMKGTPEADVIPELAPRPGDYVLEKRTYSGFYETGLDLLLRSLGVDTVVVTGLHTHMCCRHTAADAFARGFSIVAPPDCLNAFTQEDHEAGLKYLKEVYGARMAGSADLMGEWGRG